MDKNTLKSYFSTGKKPTQGHFAQLIDSFRHKDEEITISDIKNLSSALSDKVTREDLPYLIDMDVKQDKEDENLLTDNKNIVGAINELEEDLNNCTWDIEEHSNNSEIHVTEQEKEKWDNQAHTHTNKTVLDNFSYTDLNNIPESFTPSAHTHDERYYTETETDAKLAAKADITNLNSTVSSHNTNSAAHNDIRVLIETLTSRLNGALDSEDVDLDQLSEIVAYIKSNRSLIEEITTNKVNVSDIIDNLTANLTNKPLSAAQGVVLKQFIDTLNELAHSHDNKAILDRFSYEDLQDKPNSFTPSAHTHNDLYYSETEIDSMLAAKAEAADMTAHAGNKTNPHSVTKSQVGLGNVPNLATNDQTPTYTAASANAALTSGEKISVAFGKIAKAVSSLISHLADSVSHITAAERSTWNAKATTTDLNNHTENIENPHEVNKIQIGLSEVPNVTTNDQTPTYTTANENSTLTSGEKISVAFGKIAKAVSSLIVHLGDSVSHTTTEEKTTWNSKAEGSHTHDNRYYTELETDTLLSNKANSSELISHVFDTNNPHSVTKSQVGLSNVPNLATNDQTPTYTAASANAALTSGEKISVAFGKIAKAVSSLISHLADSVSHITAAERSAWNAKADITNLNSTVSSHNTNSAAHNDIRVLIETLTSRLNGALDSEDVDLDQLSEIVAYIKSNRSLIEEITTNKVNVSDIIDNLTANLTNKPLSAAQGVVLKQFIDTLNELAHSHDNKAILDRFSYEDLQDKPNSFTPSAHTHNDLYYSETEIDSMLAAKAEAADMTDHTENKTNPHSVTKSQVGLGNVPNLATNDQTPTYTAASANAALTSGEKISVAFGKIAKAVSSLISHLADSVSHITAAERSTWNAKAAGSHTHNDLYYTETETDTLLASKADSSNLTAHTGNSSNPHSVTKSQVGLGNVPNLATNDQTPTYTAASANAALTSGEKISVAFGKIAKAVGSLISHLADSVSHITAAERSTWNAKAAGSHTHNYAGSQNAGGPANTLMYSLVHSNSNGGVYVKVCTLPGLSNTDNYSLVFDVSKSFVNGVAHVGKLYLNIRTSNSNFDNCAFYWQGSPLSPTTAIIYAHPASGSSVSSTMGEIWAYFQSGYEGLRFTLISSNLSGNIGPYPSMVGILAVTGTIPSTYIKTNVTYLPVSSASKAETSYRTYVYSYGNNNNGNTWALVATKNLPYTQWSEYFTELQITGNHNSNGSNRCVVKLKISGSATYGKYSAKAIISGESYDLSTKVKYRLKDATASNNGIAQIWLYLPNAWESYGVSVLSENEYNSFNLTNASTTKTTLEENGYTVGSFTRANIASKTQNALNILINDTDYFTFDGSGAKTLNLSPALIGAYKTEGYDSYIAVPSSGASTEYYVLIFSVTNNFDGQINLSGSTYTTQYFDVISIKAAGSIYKKIQLEYGNVELYYRYNSSTLRYEFYAKTEYYSPILYFKTIEYKTGNIYYNTDTSQTYSGTLTQVDAFVNTVVNSRITALEPNILTITDSNISTYIVNGYIVINKKYSMIIVDTTTSEDSLTGIKPSTNLTLGNGYRITVLGNCNFRESVESVDYSMSPYLYDYSNNYTRRMIRAFQDFILWNNKWYSKWY